MSRALLLIVMACGPAMYTTADGTDAPIPAIGTECSCDHAGDVIVDDRGPLLACHRTPERIKCESMRGTLCFGGCEWVVSS